MPQKCLLTVALTAILFVFSSTFAAEARVEIYIDKSSQWMTVGIDGVLQHEWRVSTGKAGYSTPSGDFTPSRMKRDHFSREWDDAPMPHSIFFTERGHAIHGSTHTSRLGTPASHGCVRLSPENAAVLFELVEREGMNNTRIVITGWDQEALTYAPPTREIRRRTRGTNRTVGRFWLGDRKW